MIAESDESYHVDRLILDKWNELGPIAYEALYNIGAFKYKNGYFEKPSLQYKLLLPIEDTYQRVI